VKFDENGIMTPYLKETQMGGKDVATKKDDFADDN
jgi:hypothetical protein